LLLPRVPKPNMITRTAISIPRAVGGAVLQPIKACKDDPAVASCKWQDAAEACWEYLKVFHNIWNTCAPFFRDRKNERILQQSPIPDVRNMLKNVTRSKLKRSVIPANLLGKFVPWKASARARSPSRIGPSATVPGASCACVTLPCWHSSRVSASMRPAASSGHMWTWLKASSGCRVTLGKRPANSTAQRTTWIIGCRFQVTPGILF